VTNLPGRARIRQCGEGGDARNPGRGISLDAGTGEPTGPARGVQRRQPKRGVVLHNGSNDATGVRLRHLSAFAGVALLHLAARRLRRGPARDRAAVASTRKRARVRAGCGARGSGTAGLLFRSRSPLPPFPVLNGQVSSLPSY